MRDKCAIFTIVQDDSFRLRHWLRHYAATGYPLFVLDHESTTEHILGMDTLATQYNFTRVRVGNGRVLDHVWLRAVVQAFQHFLLQSTQYVLFAEVDEVVVPRPGRTHTTLRDYIEACQAPLVVCDGYEIVQDLDTEEQIIWSDLPLLQQRKFWCSSRLYSKPLLSRIPLSWELGFHTAAEASVATTTMSDCELLLLHWHKLDFQLMLDRQRSHGATLRVADCDRRNGWGYQNWLADEVALRDFWVADADYPQQDRPAQLTVMPDEVRVLF